ncbi:MAG: hypothetical protein K0B11_13775, partial [Mariniphaga sp.]|nr:hypothetical protein [Mariniphaga sp.]
LNNKSHTLSFQYAPITPDRFLTRRFEIVAGIGVSLNSLDFQLMKFGRFIQFSEDPYDHYDIGSLYNEHIKELRAGLLLLADCSYYLSKAVSLNVTFEKSFLRDLETEQKTIKIPETGESVTFESQKINPSSFSYSFGIRFHF